MEGDKEMIEHFRKIINTVTVVVVFLFIGVTVGIYLGYAFFEKTPTWKNIVFYIVYALLFVIALSRVRKIWKF